MLNTALIDAIVSRLPRHSEEGNLPAPVERRELAAQVMAQTGLAEDLVGFALDMVERLLDSLAVLDRHALSRGEWRFVSFPAQLAALSVLSVFADPAQHMVKEYFWHSPQHDNEQEEQRKWLKFLERNRVGNHAAGQAVPIRYITVAWAFIKLDGRFLLHHREDKTRPDERNYVPVGGRVSPADLQGFSEYREPRALLELLQSPAPVPAVVLENALLREVEEEAGLSAGHREFFSLWRSLRPYREIQGARANHGYTQYAIHK